MLCVCVCYCMNVCVCILNDAEVTSTSTRPVGNVVITTKGLQDRNNLVLDGRWKIKVN